MLSLYIHIPFCAQACHYCDFHFSTNFSQKKLMVESICEEMSIRVQREKEGKAENIYPSILPPFYLSSLYFGGGTPSVLEAGELKQIFQTIQEFFVLKEGAEITLEANPNDLTEEKLDLFREVGINRLSIGIQSFYEPHLRYLNRNHNPDDSFACLERSKKAGFDAFTLDLIYGIPASSHKIWEEDMRLAVGMGVNHISAYALTIEPKTVFGKWVGKGKMPAPEEEFQAEQMEMLMDFLPAQGFEQYEISNFAKNEAYSQHNTHYWKKGAYWGIGPSAHSYTGQARHWNISNNTLYIKEIQQGNLPTETEILTLQDHKNELILTSLRTKWGCDVSIFQNSPTHMKELENLEKNGFLYIENNLACLTKKGKLVADAVTERLLFE